MDKPANRFCGEQRVEIKPGEYGKIEFHGFRYGYAHLNCATLLTANELREASHFLAQLAEMLSEIDGHVIDM